MYENYYRDPDDALGMETKRGKGREEEGEKEGEEEEDGGFD